MEGASKASKVVLTIRLTPEERQAVRVAAAEAGLSMEAFARGRLFGGPAKAKAYPEPKYIPGPAPQTIRNMLAQPRHPLDPPKRIRDEQGNRL